MKKLILIWVFLNTMLPSIAQDDASSCCIIKKNLVGAWQRNLKIAANGSNQNFIFKNDGTFVLNVGDDGDDAVGIIKLRGKYRLAGDEIYFTILSRTVVDGSLETGDPGVTKAIFEFGANSTLRTMKEPNPKELDPCYITVMGHSKIKINNQVYYKIK